MAAAAGHRTDVRSSHLQPKGEGLFDFRILGPLQVVRGGQNVDFRGGRERAVLALLVLNANRTVSSEHLAEELWRDSPPEGAASNLRVYVSRIRRALGDPGDVVVTRPAGYLLRVGPAAIDAARFEALLAQGRSRAAEGDYRGAAGTLREALSLWRGPALVDLADVPSARAEAARLEEARLSALEERLEADLACGRHGELAAELDAVTRAHPLRERLWAQRMIALYRAGRQAEALRAYQDLRQTLGEQLGIEPSSALRQLETAILRHDHQLEWLPTEDTPPDAGGQETGELPHPFTAEPAPLPLPLGREERVPLVGRARELAWLDAAWTTACSGERRLVLLSGEPGIGKTRLMAEVARRAHAGRATVLFGRCDEGMGVPYQPFVEALGRYLRESPAPVLGRLAGELVRLVPEVTERGRDLPSPLRSDPETERYRLFDAVVAWLAAASEATPVLLVLDDLNWGTKPTLLLLRHLVRSDEVLSLLAVVAYRDSPLDMNDDVADVLAELLRQPGVQRMSLSGLEETEVAALMENRAQHELDDDGRALAGVIHAETAGNPFFVRELLRHLAEKGVIVYRDDRWVAVQPVADVDVPDSVREVVGRRLTRLPDETIETLALAAVLGERFELAVLAKASGASEDSTLRALAPAVAARLVEETGVERYHFGHALVRSTLQDTLGPTRRAQLHRAAGRAVETVHASDLAEHLAGLTRHFTLADDRARAVDYATRAGHRALVQLAHDDAARYYRSALDLLDDAGHAGNERLQLLIALGEAQRRAGDPGHRETLFAAARLARQLGDTDALARAALANSRAMLYSVVGGVDHERVAVLEEALAATADAPDSLIRARLLATLGLELTWSGQQRRLDLSDEALDLARPLGDPATLFEVLLARYYAIASPDTRSERFANTTELLALADQLSDDATRSRALALRFRVAMESADVAEADRCLEANTRLAAELGQPTLRWVVGLQRAGRSLLAGRLEEAAHLAHDTLEVGRSTGQPEAESFFVWQQAAILFEQGRLGEMLDQLLEAASEYPGVSTARSMVALAYAELGRIAKAREVFEQLAAAEFGHVPVDSIWLRCLTDCAAVCADLGDVDGAAALYPLLAPYPDHLPVFVIGTAGPSVMHSLGLLAATMGRFDNADEHFAAAAATHERIEAPAWLAVTRLEWARMLLGRRARGDSERARKLLDQALGVAQELGLGSIERRAGALPS